MKIIPTRPIPAQSLLVSLDGQPCQIDLRQTDFGLFANFWLNNLSTPTLAGVLCQDRNRIIRDAYFGFAGDIGFVDQQGTSDPDYTGLGSRYLLYYLESGAAASAGIASATASVVTIPGQGSTTVGAFTLATGVTTTNVLISGLLTTSSVLYSPAPGASSFYASAMYPDIQPQPITVAGTLTLIHPVTANTCTYNYLVKI